MKSTQPKKSKPSSKIKPTTNGTKGKTVRHSTPKNKSLDSDNHREENSPEKEPEVRSEEDELRFLEEERRRLERENEERKKKLEELMAEEKAMLAEAGKGTLFMVHYFVV